MNKDKKVKRSKPEKQLAAIQFVGKRKRINKKTGKPVLVARAAPKFIIDGNTKINLPSADALAKGVLVDAEAVQKARELFPDDFKTPVKKGAKK